MRLKERVVLRNVLAFLLCPFPAALIQALLVAAWPQRGGGILAHPASMFAFHCLLIYGLEIFPGVPVLLLLRWRGLNGLVSYALAGIGVVSLPVLLWLSWALSKVATPPHLPADRLALDLLNLGASGLLTGAAFWAISRPRVVSTSYAEVFE